MRLFDLFEDTNQPSDDDLFGTGEIGKVRQSIIDELDNILMNYHEYPSLHNHQPVEATKKEYAAIKKVRDTFEQRGMITGLRSLDTLRQDIINHLDAELAWNHNIILGKIEEKYLNENEPSDDELFGTDKKFIQAKLASLAREWYHADDYRLKQRYVNSLDALGYDIDYSENGVAIWNKENSQGDEYDVTFYPPEELDESVEPTDDELFGKDPKKSDLSKVSTYNLIDLLHSFNSDTRPEYESVHSRLKFRISRELERRGVPVPHGINENEPTDDELFGNPATDISQKYGKEIEAYSEMLEMSAADWVNSNGLSIPDELAVDMINDAKIIQKIGQTFRNYGMKQGIKEFKQLSRSLQDDIVEWLHQEDMDDFDEYISESDPSDEELFGNRSTVITHRVINLIKNVLIPTNSNRIIEILDSHNAESVEEIDGDNEDNWDDIDEINELSHHIKIIKTFVSAFELGLEQGLGYYVSCIRGEEGGESESIAEYIEYKAYHELNINLAELAENILGETL